MRFQTEKPEQQRRWFSERGQSAVELAIVVPVLALMLVVIADFARVFYVSIAVNNAARAGAQFGSQSSSTASTAEEPSGMQQAACNDYGISDFTTCQTTLNPTATMCTCGTPSTGVPACSTISATYCSHTASATYVTVNTSATYHTILNYPGITSSYTLTGQAIMQVQGVNQGN
jgi:Flp pilus assembly protein TadG